MAKKVSRNTTVLFALMAAAGLVQAADANWAGVYVGIDGGLGNHSDAKWKFPADGGSGGTFSPQTTGGTFDHAMDGKLWGVHVGENRQFGNLVVGLEGFFASTDIDGGKSSDVVSGPVHIQTRYQAAIKNLETLTPRVGYAFGNWMPYGKAGLALAEIDTRMRNTSTSIYSFHRGHYHFGWTAGIGLEYALPSDSTGAWVFGAEYNYYQFASRTYGGESVPIGGNWPIQYDLKPTARTLTLRASYNFGAHSKAAAGGGSSGGSWEGLFAGIDYLTAIQGSSNWKFPVGGNAAGSFAPNAGGAFGQSPTGSGWGIHVGENRQFGNLVLGVEGSWATTDIGATKPGPFAGLTGTAKTNVTSLVTLTPKVGYAIGNWLPYAKVGFAVADVRASLRGTNATFYPGGAPVGAPLAFEQTHLHEGKTAGIGVEYMLPLATQNLLVGLEYNRYEFNAKDYGGKAVPDNTYPVQFNLRPSITAINARLSYKF